MSDRFLGEISKATTFAATCAMCNYMWASSFEDKFTNQKEFITSIRKMGWRQIDRRWVCPKHKKESE